MKSSSPGNHLNIRHCWLPDDQKRDLAQFNVFSLVEPNGTQVNCGPYDRSGYYKIAVVTGHTRLYYADKSFEFLGSALVFTNCNVPYTFEHVKNDQTGYFCVFTEAFIDKFSHIKEYPVFKPGISRTPLFELTPAQAENLKEIFKKMQAEVMSDYIYKNDVLLNLIVELVHSALKLQPAPVKLYNESNGTLRISSTFTDLMERQFPIASTSQQIKFRTPVEFAEQLSVHTNSLNRSLKETTGKTTSQYIADRILQEARGLLRHTAWNISEIAWCLGFSDLSHFLNFFKKREGLTPKSFRMVREV